MSASFAKDKNLRENKSLVLAAKRDSLTNATGIKWDTR
jgi:hypothetical protein